MIQFSATEGHASADVCVIGGGVIGLSVAWGLAETGWTVILLDGADTDFRASKSNFGLIMVQGKGKGMPAYFHWTLAASQAWPELAGSLRQRTGIDVALKQSGGLNIAPNAEALKTIIASYGELAKSVDGAFDFEILDRAALKDAEPHIGPKMVGAAYCRQDGHVNPLRFARALAAAAEQSGVTLRANALVRSIKPVDAGFEIRTAQGGVVHAGKVVLSAGLGSNDLAASLGFKSQLSPFHGQLMITEKLPHLLNYPNLILRQVDEGGIQIGYSAADLGYSDKESLETMQQFAKAAIDMLPALSKAKALRSWGALRIMSPDGLPIYQQSKDYPGAYFITCHSGVTLASKHVFEVPKWITGASDAPDLTAFSEERFHA